MVVHEGRLVKILSRIRRKKNKERKFVVERNYCPSCLHILAKRYVVYFNSKFVLNFLFENLFTSNVVKVNCNPAVV